MAESHFVLFASSNWAYTNWTMRFFDISCYNDSWLKWHPEINGMTVCINLYYSGNSDFYSFIYTNTKKKRAPNKGGERVFHMYLCVVSVSFNDFKWTNNKKSRLHMDIYYLPTSIPQPVFIRAIGMKWNEKQKIKSLELHRQIGIKLNTNTLNLRLVQRSLRS